MRTLFSWLMVATVVLLIIYGLAVAARPAFGSEGGTTPPGDRQNHTPSCDFQGQVVDTHVLIWVTGADPSETLECWLVMPTGQVAHGQDRWPLVLPALVGEYVLVVRRPDGTVCVHPYRITAPEPGKTSRYYTEEYENVQPCTR